MTEPRPLLAAHPHGPAGAARFEAGDLAAYHAYQSLPETARFLPGEAKSYTQSMAAVGKYANFAFDKEGDWICLAIEAADAPGLLGEVVLKWLPGRGQAEIGWSLAPAARGKGIGRKQPGPCCGSASRNWASTGSTPSWTR